MIPRLYSKSLNQQIKYDFFSCIELVIAPESDERTRSISSITCNIFSFEKFPSNERLYLLPSSSSNSIFIFFLELKLKDLYFVSHLLLINIIVNKN